MSIFLTGIMMQHYNSYSLSEESRKATIHLFKTLSFFAEIFVFVAVGLSVPLYIEDIPKYWDLILFVTFVGIFARACNSFPLSNLANLKRKVKITLPIQFMHCISALRGSVAFALALNIVTKNPENQPIIVSSIVMSITLSTFTIGFCVSPLLKKLNLVVDPTDPSIDSVGLTSSSNVTSVEEKTSFFHSNWRRIDDGYIKKYLGGKTADTLDHSQSFSHSPPQPLSQSQQELEISNVKEEETSEKFVQLDEIEPNKNQI